MTLMMKRRLAALVAVAISGAALWNIAQGDLEESLVYYWTPTELIAAAQAREATVRLGGMVKPGSLEWDRDAQRAEFTITDGKEEIFVSCEGNPPQMFQEGIGAVVEGMLGEDDVFRTDRVMVKHSNEYSAPEGHHSEAGRATLIEEY